MCGGRTFRLLQVAPQMRTRMLTRINVSSANIKECTFGNARQNCPKDKRMELELAESSMVAAFDALCENEGSLLKTVLNTYQCWNFPAFFGCIQQLPLTTKNFDFFAKRTEKDLEVLKKELPKCVALSKINSAQCAQVDVGSIEKLIHTFIGRTVPGYNAASQACLSAAALLSIVLALVFTRSN
ncbi:uncharacterized protein LOC119386703 [Rhipicephalus sanguineus]|uniref:uncharacterized protein LOC119386703 n=1 Tax=Rhipicephalus sanguineus TaxID=34632 RepID=UPI0020C32110|nr:uncharacterized protein LOC119386703 [Rhipicephalus sanguineus]